MHLTVCGEVSCTLLVFQNWSKRFSAWDLLFARTPQLYWDPKSAAGLQKGEPQSWAPCTLSLNSVQGAVTFGVGSSMLLFISERNCKMSNLVLQRFLSHKSAAEQVIISHLILSAFQHPYSYWWLGIFHKNQTFIFK